MIKKGLLSLATVSALLFTNSYSSESIVKSKVPTLKFSGTHYLGFVHNSPEIGDNTNNFETRRNYFQVKAYMNKKDFFRITFDTHNIDDGSDTVGKDLNGTWNVRLKYAYLYIDEIMTNTGIEIGQVHRPWIDFEEHGNWNYRSINKVFIEDKQAAHLTNSADLGFNLKTKTDIFSSEIGLFNGEGYHSTSDGQGISFEYRLTYHAFNTGKEKRKADKEYLDISVFGANSPDDSKRGDDFEMTAISAVYNNPSILVAGQYVTADNGTKDKYAGKGYSINTEIRPFDSKKNFFIARYDVWNQEDAGYKNGDHADVKTSILGVVHKYNKNVKFIANVKDVDFDKIDGTPDDEHSFTDIMLTAEVKW